MYNILFLRTTDIDYPLYKGELVLLNASISFSCMFFTNPGRVITWGVVDMFSLSGLEFCRDFYVFD